MPLQNLMQNDAVNKSAESRAHQNFRRTQPASKTKARKIYIR